MRYNLKNHPPVDPRNCDLEDWFESFEKELREWKEKYIENAEAYIVLQNFIKEILGE